MQADDDMAVAAPAIRLRGIDKTYANGVVALSGIDLDIRRGEFAAIVGASGCGKSTLLRIIAGLTGPSAGTCSVEAGGVATPKIGFVFQEPTLMPWRSLAGNVGLPLQLAGVPAREQDIRVAEALALVGLDGFAHALPRELSGGMKMRASIARALVTKPDILLMDEPFAALDEITRLRLNDDLLDLWQAIGKTVLFVTHSVFEAVYLAERVIVLSRRPGRVHAEFAFPVATPRPPDFRTSPAYPSQCDKVLRALRQTVQETPA